MRLLLITPLYPPAVGGAATYFADIVPQLATYEHIEKVFVLTEKMAGQPQQSSDGKVEILRLLPTRVSQQRPFLYHTLTYLQTQQWFATKLNKLITANKIDIVQYHTRFRGRFFYRAMKNTPYPVIADLRDKLSDPQALREASHHLLCCSKGIVAFAESGGYPKEKVHYIPATFKKPSLPSPAELKAVLDNYQLEKQKYILYLGDMNYNKGVYELIKAFQIWHKTQADAKLIMAGTNRDGDTFLTALQDKPFIQYLGHVQRTDVPALITGTELLILPSRSEGLPTVILEAVSLQTKVICPPNVAEFAQHLPETILPEISVAAIVEKLDLVWNNKDTPTYPLEQHEPKTIVAQLVNFYAQL